MIPVTHELKIHKEYADAIVSGEKTFEIRLDDRHYQKGDKIHFYEVNDGRPVKHQITEKLYEITYILYGKKSGWFGLKEDWCVFAIKEIESEDQPEHKSYDGHRVGDEIVADDGIYRVTKIDGYAGYESVRIMTKEAFTEAYNKYIANDKSEAD